MISLESIRAASPFIAAGALVIGSSLVGWACNRADTAEAKLKQAEERLKLAKAGITAEVESSTRDLRRALEDERGRSAAFAKSLDDAEAKLREAGAKAKPVEVVRWRTAEGEAYGPPAPPPKPEASQPAPSLTCSCICLVYPGTRLLVEANEGRMETRSGNRFAVGAADVFRLDPTGPVSIFSQPIDMKLVSGVVEEKPLDIADRPWIAGVAGSIDKDGDWGVGPTFGYARSRVIGSLSFTLPNRVGVGSIAIRF